MTWKEFKDTVESAGITNEREIAFIDIEDLDFKEIKISYIDNYVEIYN